MQCSHDGRHIAGCQVSTFTSNPRELLRRQPFGARIREQPVDHSGDVPHVKRSRSDSAGARVPFFLSQVLDQLVGTFSNLKENVRNGLEESWNAPDRPSLPPLCISHGPARACPYPRARPSLRKS